MEADGRLMWRGIAAARVGEGVKGRERRKSIIKNKVHRKMWPCVKVHLFNASSNEAEVGISLQV